MSETRNNPGEHGKYSTYAHGCRCQPCREAWREYRREHAKGYRKGKEEQFNRKARETYKRNREEALSLLGGCCVWCGSKDKLEFDHIDPKSKTRPINETFRQSRKVWMEELKKCQLLCRPCHVLKTSEEGSFATANR